MILILFLCTLAIGLLAQWHVRRAYARHSHTPVQSGYTGAEAAHAILRQAGISVSHSLIPACALASALALWLLHALNLRF